MFYQGRDIEKSEFTGGKKAIIDETLCIQCGKCETVCRFDAIENCKINSFTCEGCTDCTRQRDQYSARGNSV